MGLGGILREQEKGHGKEQDCSFYYCASSLRHGVPPVGEGTGSGPAWPVLTLTIIQGQKKMQKQLADQTQMGTGKLDGKQRGGDVKGGGEEEDYLRRWATSTS